MDQNIVSLINMRIDDLKEDLNKNVDGMKVDINEIKDDVKILLHFKWQIVGGSVTISVILTILMNIFIK